MSLKESSLNTTDLSSSDLNTSGGDTPVNTSQFITSDLEDFLTSNSLNFLVGEDI